MKTIQSLIVALLAMGTEQLSYAADEAGDPSPFPPGPNAMLVKQTCSKCHSPNVIVTQTFS